jgi:hypothetical protein
MSQPLDGQSGLPADRDDGVDHCGHAHPADNPLTAHDVGPLRQPRDEIRRSLIILKRQKGGAVGHAALDYDGAERIAI